MAYFVCLVISCRVVLLSCCFLFPGARRPFQDRARQHGSERQLVPGPGGGHGRDQTPPQVLLPLQQLAKQGGGGPPLHPGPAGQHGPHGDAKMYAHPPV